MTAFERLVLMGLALIIRILANMQVFDDNIIKSTNDFCQLIEKYKEGGE